MKKTIELQGQAIEYTLKISPRAHRLRLAIYGDGNFVVTAPRRLSIRAIDNFIISKSSWIIKKLTYFKNNPSLKSKPLSAQEDKKNYQKHKESARSLVQERLEHFNQIYNLRFKRVSIRNQKTRWGSCSQKANLNFNYKIVLLPAKLADYIIVHELCHLQELNHSLRFWNLVAQTVPDYVQVRKELKHSNIDAVILGGLNDLILK